MEDIKKLRSLTGCGIGDCKVALDESQGNMEKAVEILRKKGIAKAAKREDREASQGIIKLALSADHKIGYLVEVNAETDFVVRNQKFQDFADQVLAIVQEQKPANREALLALPMTDGTVKTNLDVLSGTIGEKLDIKNVAVVTSQGTVASYAHAGGTIGVLVALDQPDQDALAYDIAMQVAASNPRYIKPEEVVTTELDKEKEVYREQLRNEGKPAEMIEKILTGKVNKYYEEVCLIKQEYIKDDKKKVADILGPVQVETFVRFSL
ncbi:MAG: Elongation factor Ts [Candidatus Falkowbacteria bacterium GW2011_GWA2_39_24]|uniref:Elongation factor Ts n=1 Tax=Candidatus Falkowbacteria bacterium GW2011_GWA2_39_24 TaxID=1618634 RepID=A0A0G0NPT5_9BACT|nr:MAG: Elongation factor Ts [Candidatus Falkowbacteria bacterium GW2011_GWA2_39_24]